MTPAALMVHLRGCIAPVHLSELEKAETLVEVFNDDLPQVPHDELFPLYQLVS